MINQIKTIISEENPNFSFDLLNWEEVIEHSSNVSVFYLQSSVKYYASYFEGKNLSFLIKENNKPIGISYALGAIKNVGENSIKEIVNERDKNGSFTSLINFLKRINNSLINKRQMEFYQWLLRQNGFKVSNDGYFVYCNGIKDKDSFDEVLEFRVKILHYQGDDSWVEPTLLDIYKALQSNSIPKKNDECDTCSYVETRFEISTNKK